MPSAIADGKTTTEASVTDRHKRIQDLTAENELDRAVRELLDLASEYGHEDQRREAISVSSRLHRMKTDHRRFPDNRENERRSSEIVGQILALADEIAKRSLIEVSRTPTDPPVTTSCFGGPILTPPIDTLTPPTDNLTPLERDRAHLAQRLYSPQALSNSTVFRCNQLKKTFGRADGAFALEAVSISIEFGTITGVVGANGHGKTTLLHLIAGHLAADGGTIEYPALTPVTSGGGDWREWKRQMAYVPQLLNSWGRGDLTTSLQARAALAGRIGRENNVDVEFFIERLGLQDYRYAEWHHLSGGYRLRAALAQALIQFPRLLILDEPLANLDINAQLLLLQDLRDLVGSRKSLMAVIATSQHLHEIESIAHMMLFLEHGKPKYWGPTNGVGSDRTENAYELQCDRSRAEVSRICQGLCPIAVEELGVGLLVRMPRAVTAGDLLGALFIANVSVRYFRDISFSTRSWLRSERH